MQALKYNKNFKNINMRTVISIIFDTGVLTIVTDTGTCRCNASVI